MMKYSEYLEKMEGRKIEDRKKILQASQNQNHVVLVRKLDDDLLESAVKIGITNEKMQKYFDIVGNVTQEANKTVCEFLKKMFEKVENLDSEEKSILANIVIHFRNNSIGYYAFGNVLDDVAARWGDFSVIEKATLSSVFSDIKNREYFFVLMENYSATK